MKGDLWDYTQYYLSPWYKALDRGTSQYYQQNEFDRANYYDLKDKINELKGQYPDVPEEVLENIPEHRIADNTLINRGGIDKSYKVFNTYGLKENTGNYLKILNGLKPFWSQSPFFDGAGYKRLSPAEQSKLPQYLLYLYGNDSNFKRAIDSGNTDLANALLDNSLLNDKDYLKKSLTYGKKDFNDTNIKATEVPNNTGTSSPPEEPSINSVGQSMLSASEEPAETKSAETDTSPYKLTYNDLTDEQIAKRQQEDRQRYLNSLNNTIDPYANTVTRKNLNYMYNRGY